jgi:RNA polymerase sigma-70 factor (ECF subfamily)
MHRRAAKSRPVFTDEQPADAMLDAREPQPDEDFARRERVRAFQRLLDRLAEKKRVVFILHELEGMAPAEIAKVVGAPILTVRTRLFYARRELQAMLSDEPTLASMAADLAVAARASDPGREAVAGGERAEEKMAASRAGEGSEDSERGET